MDYQDYRNIVLDQINSVLKPEGFRKTANTFSANKNDVVLFVQLQSSSKTVRTMLVATVNFGIVSLVIAEKEGIKSKVKFLDSHWRERIGFFLPKPFDKWWEIQSEQEAVAAGLEISQIIEKQTLPKLYTLSSTNNLVALWQSGRSPGMTEFQRKNLLALAEK
jgi:hypothetical protein